MTDDPRLTEALRSKARSFDPHLADIDEIVGRAHAIRRRRRTTAGLVAAAAVVAVALPTALVLRPDAATRVTPAGPPSSVSVTPSPAKPTPSTPSTPAPSLSQIARGAATTLTYALGARVFTGDSSTARLPVTDARSFASYKGGWLVATSVGGQDTVSQYDASGHLVAAHPGNGPVTSQDGTEVAWWWQDAANGAGHVYVGGASSMGSGAGATATPAGTQVTVLGFSPEGVVYESNVPGAAPAVWTAGYGPTPVRVPGLATAQAVLQSPAMISGEPQQGTGATGCPTVFSLPGMIPLWKLCGGSTLGGFSPSGKAVVAVDQGAARVRILDAQKGTPLTSYAPRAPLRLEGPVVWEMDGMAVVMPIYDTQRHTWALVRLTTSGTVDRVSAVVPGQQDAPPFAFAAPL